MPPVDNFEKLGPDIEPVSGQSEKSFETKSENVSGMKQLSSKPVGDQRDELVENGCRAKLHEVKLF